MLERRDPMKSWSPLTHRVYRLLKSHKIESGVAIVAVSGGADSMGLLMMLDDIKSALSLDLKVVHVHHGPGKTELDRSRAQKLVEDESLKLGLSIRVFRSLRKLSSEAELRAFRRSSLLEALGSDRGWIFTGHHLQDLLETRLIRLVRGTGPQGLRAIRVKQGVWVRPWLETSRKEIVKEIENRGLGYWEDPSNRQSEPLRNWIRNDWLPQLDSKRPGSLESLGRSLEMLVLGLNTENKGVSPVWLGPHTLSRGFFHTLSLNEKQQVLAQCLHALQGLNYSSGQIKEILKRLDNPKKEHTFRMRNSLWEVNAEQISVRKVFEK